MFLLNVGSRWNLATGVGEVRGAVFLASSNTHVRFTRNARPELARLMIDPQLYLAGLAVRSCAKVCSRLATHPWFCVPNQPVFDSDTMKVREWERAAATATAAHWPGSAPTGDDVADACAAAIECQLGFGCTDVILPTPLLDEREDAGGLLGEWLDAGLAAAEDQEVGQPVLATIAISQATLNNEAFDGGGFLEAVVDQVTARDGLAGVYIVVGLTGSGMHPFETPAPPLQAYLHLAHAFREARCETIILNFADVFGFVGMAVGATDIATGPSQSTRRLCLNAFRDDGGGIAVPHYYSHRVVGEFASERDLDRIVKARLFRRISDPTGYCEDLLEELASGGSAASVGAWAESQNNIAQAQRHFIARLAIEGARLQGMSPKKRRAAIEDLLEEAEATALLIQRRVGNEVGRLAPVDAWRDLLDAV